MNTSLQHLLNRYLQDEATVAEVAELMKLLSTGQHNDVVKRRIDEVLMEVSDEDMRAVRAEQMLQTIVRPIHHHETPVVPLPRTNAMRGWWWAAAAVVLLMAAGIALFLRTADQQNAPQQLAQHDDPAETVLSGKQYVRLPDGSTVLLNDESEIRYKSNFDGDTRDVVLVGEAYFDIKHQAGKPFRVHTGKVMTTVLGTAFNVKAWPDAKEVKVTVDRGKVQVSDNARTYGTITRDQQIAVNTDTYAFEQTDVRAREATEWKNDYLIFEDVSLAEAAAMIEAKYRVQVAFNNEKLRTCRVSATFLNDENLDQVMAVITTVVQATYTRNNTGITIYGAGC